MILFILLIVDEQENIQHNIFPGKGRIVPAEDSSIEPTSNNFDEVPQDFLFSDESKTQQQYESEQNNDIKSSEIENNYNEYQNQQENIGKPEETIPTKTKTYRRVKRRVQRNKDIENQEQFEIPSDNNDLDVPPHFDAQSFENEKNPDDFTNNHFDNPPIIPTKPKFNKKSRVCLGNNTELFITGECVCVSGFPYGNPEDEKGCWKCNSCSSYAECHYPGKCVCQDGWEGNGINCNPIVPTIIIMRVIKKKNLANVTFTSTEAHYPGDIAYCKFGQVVISGVVVYRGIVQCPIPQQPPGKVPFMISFDSIRWSKEDIIYQYTSSYNIIVTVVILVIVSIIIYIIFRIFVEIFFALQKPKQEDEIPFFS